MIYTVTFNPSIDYYTLCGGFETGKTNRTIREEMKPGGKGINVSIMLKKLGIESKALGFVAGFTGEEIVRSLDKMEIASDFIRLNEGVSRINIKIEDVEGTEINGSGPAISNENIAALLDKFKGMAEKDMLVLSGNVPKSVSTDIYGQIAGICEKRKIRLIVDAEGELLMNTLCYKPFLIKPNHHELGALFNTEIVSHEDAVFYGKKLAEMGAENVLISMAGNGAVLITKSGLVRKAMAVKGEFINGVGAGDSMIAGFLAGYLDKNDYDDAFRLGISAASATAFSVGLGDEKLIKNIYKKVLTTP